MAISVSFAGATIYRPGAYSKTNIDLGGNIPLSAAGLVAIFGEADAGTPGASEVDISRNFYTADRIADAKAKYRSGPILDALNFLFAPAADGAIANGAQTVWVYKTNASVRAESTNLLGTGWTTSKVQAKEYGIGGNRITLKIEVVGSARKITVSQKRDLIVETDTVGGNVVLSVTGPDKITINATKVTVVGLSLTPVDFDKAAYKTIKQLADDINMMGLTGTGLVIADARYNQMSPDILDFVVDAQQVKMDAYEVRQFFAESQLVNLIGTAVPTLGLPSAFSEAALAGGVKGATASAQIEAALTKFTKFHVNFIVPLFSRDAADDLADGLTDTASDYTIDGIHQSVRNHVSMMKSTKKRSERQGFLSIKDTYENCRTQAGTLADARMQLLIQDVRQVDSLGAIRWFQPWALACMIAGARSGASIGLPMTFKFMNCSGIRHTAQSMNTPEADIILDFDPDTQYDDAIQSGITFLEAPTTGGFRVVVDNTTYGVDDNWVWNRGNVIYAADIVAYSFRNTMELRYVGVKNTVRASEVKSTAESVLATFLAQGITVSTGDAPNGFKNLSVRVEGNVIYISVTIKLVEGIDFVLAEFTVQRATQSA